MTPTINGPISANDVVTAINSHSALVDALKEARREFAEWRDDVVGSSMEDYARQMHDRMDAALKLAGEE